MTIKAINQEKHILKAPRILKKKKKDPLVESYVCPTAAQIKDPLVESSVCPIAAQIKDPMIVSSVCPQ
jgi:hypothetical protein